MGIRSGFITHSDETCARNRHADRPPIDNADPMPYGIAKT
jgi:hypothetical protein